MIGNVMSSRVAPWGAATADDSYVAQFAPGIAAASAQFKAADDAGWPSRLADARSVLAAIGTAAKSADLASSATATATQRATAALQVKSSLLSIKSALSRVKSWAAVIKPQVGIRPAAAAFVTGASALSALASAAGSLPTVPVDPSVPHKKIKVPKTTGLSFVRSDFQAPAGLAAQTATDAFATTSVPYEDTGLDTTTLADDGTGGMPDDTDTGGMFANTYVSPVVKVGVAAAAVGTAYLLWRYVRSE